MLFSCLHFLSPSVLYVVAFRSHWIIYPDTQVVAWFAGCLPVFQGKGSRSNIFPFIPCNLLFNSLQLSGVREGSILGGPIGNCLDDYIMTCLSCGSRYLHLVVSYGILKLGMYWCLLVDGFKAFTCFYTACLHGRQVGSFTCIDIVRWLEREKMGYFKNYFQLLFPHLTNNPPTFP